MNPHTWKRPESYTQFNWGFEVDAWMYMDVYAVELTAGAGPLLSSPGQVAMAETGGFRIHESPTSSSSPILG